MDEEYTKAVGQVFIDLFREGLIYRGRRMVNWCPVSLTALSDEEVIMTEQKASFTPSSTSWKTAPEPFT